MNKDIRDKVYINGQWIDDYFLTSEKNQEIKDLRKDLTTESTTRETNNTKLASNINAVKNEANTKLNAAITSVREDIKTTAETLQNSITTEVNRAQEKENQLEQSINKEEKRANQKEKELASRIKNLETDVVSTYETKTDAENKKSTLDEKINSNYTTLDTKIDEKFNEIMGTGEIADAYNTLKEVADWITNDETGAASMTKDIADIKDKNSEQDTAIQNIKDTLSALDPDSGGVQQLVETVGKHENDITKLKSDLETEQATREDKDTELENKFNDYTTTENLKSNYVNKTELEDYYNKTDADNKFVAKDGYVAYSQEEKEKLANLNSTLYEKVENKKETIDDTADGLTYPTTKAVKDYVDNSNKATVDLSNYIRRTGESQSVEAVTSFTNLVIKQDTESEPNSVNIVVDEDGYLDIGNMIKLSDSRDAATIRDGGLDYKIFKSSDDPTKNQQTVIATLEAVMRLITSNMSQSGGESDISAILSSYSVIADTLDNLNTNISSYIDYVWNSLGEEEQSQVDKNTLKQNMNCFVLDTKKEYRYDESLQNLVEVEGSPQPSFIYSITYITNTIIYGLVLYGLDINDSNSSYKKIYPTVDSYTKIESDNKYVAKEAGKVLSTNDFNNTYKSKLDNLDSNLETKFSECEKTANRAIIIDPADNDKYPTTLAVKTYVDNNLQSISNNVSNISGRLDTTDATVSMLNETVSTLSTTTSTLSGEVETLKSKILELEETIKSLSGGN